MDHRYLDELILEIGKENVRTDESMKKHTTFRIGGEAACFTTPGNVGAIQKTLMICKKHKIPCYILGNGSNLLVGDKGYNGTIIQIYKNMNTITVKENFLEVEAGALLANVANVACDNALSGFEFASGIPGTIGGAVVMNAGAYDGEMKDVITEVKVLTKENQTLTIPGEELEWGYRTSVIAKKEHIVLGVKLRLKSEEPDRIRSRMEELKEKRILKQPLNYASAGSTFKRPNGYYAGKLIQDAGLAGFRIGEAQISEKHCGFVINIGNATARDVSMLMEEVIRRVYEKFQVKLEPEVKKLGEF